jgi:hypothetical protein
MDYKLLEIRDDGTEVRQYEDGAIRDQKGLMLEPLPGGGIQSSEKAREMVTTRFEQAKERAREGLIKGVEESGISLRNQSADEAWMFVVAHVTKTLMKSSNLRGQAEILGKLGQATGYLDPRGDGSGNSDEVAALLVRLLERYIADHPAKPERDVIEGVVQ